MQANWHVDCENPLDTNSIPTLCINMQDFGKQMGGRMRSLISGALVVLLVAAPAWALGDSSEPPATSPAAAAVAPGILYPPLPTNMSLPTYDYAAPETCAGCHFTLGLDHTSRVFGVIWNDATQTWQLTGSGWLASRHAQSDHASTEN